jgi:hypothetical protein
VIQTNLVRNQPAWGEIPLPEGRGNYHDERNKYKAEKENHEGVCSYLTNNSFLSRSHRTYILTLLPVILRFIQARKPTIKNRTVAIALARP